MIPCLSRVFSQESNESAIDNKKPESYTLVLSLTSPMTNYIITL